MTYGNSHNIWSFLFIFLSPTFAGKVMSLIERLGSFSITAAEMKFLISLLQLPNIPDMVSPSHEVPKLAATFDK